MNKGEIIINKTEHKVEANQIRLELSSRGEVVLFSPLGGSVQFASLIKSLGLVGHTVDLNIIFKEVVCDG